MSNQLSGVMKEREESLITAQIVGLLCALENNDLNTAKDKWRWIVEYPHIELRKWVNSFRPIAEERGL